MSFDFAGSELNAAELQKKFKHGKRSKRSQRMRNKLPPTATNAPEVTPSNDADKENDEHAEHAVLLSTYTFIKNAYRVVKSANKITSKIGNLAEATANKSLSIVSKLNENIPGDLQACDEYLNPALTAGDVALSPVITRATENIKETANKTVTVVNTTKQIAPIVNVARKVLPVETATKFSLWLFGKLYGHYDMIMAVEKPQQ